MAQLSTFRVKREFKEIMSSEEVKTMLFLFPPLLS